MKLQKYVLVYLFNQCNDHFRTKKQEFQWFTIRILSWDKSVYLSYGFKVDRLLFKVVKENFSQFQLHYTILFCIWHQIGFTLIRIHKKTWFIYLFHCIEYSHLEITSNLNFLEESPFPILPLLTHMNYIKPIHFNNIPLGQNG